MTVKVSSAASADSRTLAIRGDIKAFLMEKFPAARKRALSDQDHLLESGVLDSLGVLEVVEFLERDFDIRINDDELVPENFQSIQTLAAFVGRKQNQALAEST